MISSHLKILSDAIQLTAIYFPFKRPIFSCRRMAGRTTDDICIYMKCMHSDYVWHKCAQLSDRHDECNIVRRQAYIMWIFQNFAFVPTVSCDIRPTHWHTHKMQFNCETTWILINLSNRCIHMHLVRIKFEWFDNKTSDEHLVDFHIKSQETMKTVIVFAAPKKKHTHRQ